MKLKIFLSLFLVFSAQSSELPQYPGSPESVIAIYNRLHQSFVKEVCTKGTEDEFQRLFDRYRHLGYFLPFLTDGSLDRQAITNNMPALERQRVWLLRLIDELNLKETDFKKLSEDLSWLKEYMKTLMQDKKEFFFQSENAQKEELKKRALFHMMTFKQGLIGFQRRAPFFLPFDFPSPIGELRLLNDEFKGQKKLSKANEVYFYRRLIEDGTSDELGSYYDANARLTLNTIYFKLQKQDFFLSEDLYFDLKFLFGFWEKILEGGKTKQLERMKRWQRKVEARYGFYQNLLQNKVIVDGKTIDLVQLVRQENSARFDLINFVNRKESETYRFWARQTELMQALFSIETILYNEVGALDKDQFERKDVTQIILNRSVMPYYWILAPEDHLYKELPHEEGRLIVGNKWLNILFKSSEFSFSYFYIHANHRIYCPEQGGLDRKLRRENLLMGLQALKKPNWDFSATRYFSRISMPGRIDMGRVWEKDYRSYPERAGAEVKDLRLLNKIKTAYKKGEWYYLYQFTDDRGQNFRVVEINDRYWVMPLGEIRFFNYRHPDYFRYFVKKI